MHRIRLSLAAVAVLLILGVPSAFAVVGDVPVVAAQTDQLDRSGPAVTVEDAAPAPEEDAWTFRFLIPTLIGATALAVGAVVIGYGVRVRGRYRVVE